MHVGVVAFLGRPLGDVVVLGTEHVTSPNYLQHTIITPHTKLDGFARISRLYFLDPRGVPIPSRPPGEGLPHLLGTWGVGGDRIGEGINSFLCQEKQEI